MPTSHSVQNDIFPPLNCRGFYPKGRGEVIVSPIPVKELTPVTLTDPGHLTNIKIHVFVAGAVRPQVGKLKIVEAKTFAINLI